ncbi:MAG: hypothetical protein ACE5I3_04115 [Phycisphaerae bacterium]
MGRPTQGGFARAFPPPNLRIVNRQSKTVNQDPPVAIGSADPAYNYNYNYN